MVFSECVVRKEAFSVLRRRLPPRLSSGQCRARGALEPPEISEPTHHLLPAAIKSPIQQKLCVLFTQHRGQQNVQTQHTICPRGEGGVCCREGVRKGGEVARKDRPNGCYMYTQRNRRPAAAHTNVQKRGGVRSGAAQGGAIRRQDPRRAGQSGPRKACAGRRRMHWLGGQRRYAGKCRPPHQTGAAAADGHGQWRGARGSNGWAGRRMRGGGCLPRSLPDHKQSPAQAS